MRAQEKDPGPQLRFSALELSLGGRVQAQLNTTSVDGEPPSQLLLRRVRLELGVVLNEVVSGTIQPDFAGDEVSLKDAYLKLDFNSGLQVLTGNAYRPFGLLEQTSSKRILPIERGLRVRGLSAGEQNALASSLGYGNRDIGIQLQGAPEGAPSGFAYRAGVFRGPLHGEVGAQDSYQFAARVTLRPRSGLGVGAGWSTRDFVAGAGDTPDLERGNAFEIDVEWGSFGPGVHLLAELSAGDLDPSTDATFRGAQAWLAYRTGALTRTVTALEPVLRLSHTSTDAPDGTEVVPGGTLFTPGINLYLGPLNRVMLNYDAWFGAEGSPDARSFKAMFQLAF
jgi:hypothetical protein